MPHHFPYLLDPTRYPDYERRWVRVPTWETFRHTPQFTTLRGFGRKDRKLVEIARTLDEYTVQFGLGRVIWPMFQTAYAENFWEFVAEIERRGLYLFDIWGHVPGSEPGDGFGHMTPPRGMVKRLAETLGERFLGFDNGEQDGRYIGGYARQQCPSPDDRFRQYLNFQRHFERMCDDLGNRMSALVSLSFGHYFLKEGNHLLLGAETAQALPNSQVYYAFIRGAGKQYGVHWFGNASVFNRWGYKSYESEGRSGGYTYGPTDGTSLALLKRLLYTHYLYNSVAVGFESGWIVAHGGERRLSPIGAMQSAAARLVEEQGQPGTMHAPVALFLDHFAGWTVPRHLYTEAVYQVWGGMPYDAGDYLTHAVFSLAYPGYEDASYFRDERGFLAPTPYGDMLDVLLSDAPGWTMRSYGLIIAAGALSAEQAGAETREKLEEFVDGGGNLVVTAENARKLWPEWGMGNAARREAGSRVRMAGGAEIVEPHAFDLCSFHPPEGADILARCGEAPAVVRISRGEGCITLVLSPFGLNAEPLVRGPIRNEPEEPLACPYVLLGHVRHILDEALRSERLFSVGEGLSYVTCRSGGGDYVIGIQNNDLFPRPFSLVCHCGDIVHIAEIPLDQSEKAAPGYWPEGKDTDGGASDAETIAGGDVRLFRVGVREEGLRLIEQVAPSPRSRRAVLAVRDVADLKAAILAWPTFFQHFDGVKVDWTYLRRRDRKQLEREGKWLARQKTRIVVDFRPGLNFYPDLTLLDTFAPRYAESVAAMDDVLDKMAALGAREAVVSLHRKPEIGCDDERAEERFRAGVRGLCRRGYERGTAFFLEHHPHKWAGTGEQTARFVDDIGAPNLTLALSTAHLAGDESPESLAELLRAFSDRIGAVILAAPRTDLFGQWYDAHATLEGSDMDFRFLADVPKGALAIFDARYATWSEVYRDVRLWKQVDGAAVGATL